MICRGETRFSLGPNSHVLLERVWPARLRLINGEVTAEGANGERNAIDLDEGLVVEGSV